MRASRVPIFFSDALISWAVPQVNSPLSSAWASSSAWVASLGEHYAPGDTDLAWTRLTRWRESLARDPWVEEALHLMKEMHATAP